MGRGALCVALYGLLLVLTLLSGAVLALNRPAEPIVIFDEAGALRGTWEKSARNRTFTAFRGIPYAAPPVGELRFQPPQPPAPYSLVDARAFRSPCPQMIKGRAFGNEDCLYLNVYSPRYDGGGMPVLVMLSGDDWALGYGGRWMPHRLMDRDVVFVSVQSRLGALGYLSTGDEVVPGNMGLLDETMALAWVRRNIHMFGGDPQRVTLGGVGAGAAAVQLHSLSPKSQGLFQRAIVVSGSALSPWTISSDPVRTTRRLAEGLNCNCTSVVNATSQTGYTTAASNNTAVNQNTTAVFNSTKAVQCLRQRTALDIVAATARLQGWMNLPPSPFTPVVDRAAKAPFVPAPVSAQWKANKTAAVPVLTGVAGGEGLMLFALKGAGELDIQILLRELDKQWDLLVPLLLAFNDTAESQRTEAAAALRKRYLGDQTPSANVTQLVKLIGDRHVVVPMLRSLELQAESTQAPAFLYRFSWTGLPTPSPIGPQGGRDAALLLMQPNGPEGDDVRGMAEDVLDLWVSFMSTGVPTVNGTKMAAATTSLGPGNATAPFFVNLLGPGLRSNGTWAASNLTAFWSELPLAENHKQGNSAADGTSPGSSSKSSATSWVQTPCWGMTAALLVAILISEV